MDRGPRYRTPAQIVSSIQGARDLLDRGVVGASWSNDQRHLYALRADGETIHSDHLPARSFSTLAALANLEVPK